VTDHRPLCFCYLKDVSNAKYHHAPNA
jgi:hypothetical protein